jgi:pentatricopeptide repeat protein
LGTRVQICGPLIVQIERNRVESALRGRQCVLLFVYLAVNRDRLVTRDELIEAIWPRALPPAPDAALSVLLSRTRRALGAGAIEGRSQLRLALPDAQVDWEAATAAIHRAESSFAQKDWPAVWGPARVALQAAERGVLPGFDAPWIDDLRRGLEDVRLRALACIGVSSLALGGAELPAAERAGRSLIALAPLRETGYGLLMDALCVRGNPAEALAVYEDLRRRLRDELGAVPSPELQRVHRTLLGADVASTA